MEIWNTILFVLGGRPVLLIDLLSAVVGLTVVFLAGRNNKYNFYVGYLYTALLFFMFCIHFNAKIIKSKYRKLPFNLKYCCFAIE